MKIKSSNKISPEFSMSSMTDIVFLLLVFFMITANTTSALDLVLPQANGKGSNKKGVTVSITKKGDAFFINDISISEDNLEQKLIEVMKEKGETSIILRSEYDVPVQNIVTVMDVSSKNGYKVILAVRGKK